MDLFANVGNVQQSMDYSHIQNNQNNVRNIEQSASLKDKNEEVQKEEKKKMTEEELRNLTEQLNKEMEPLNPDIKFQFDDKSDELVVNVVDKNTDRVIRKVPSDEALKLMEKMRELVGALFDDKG